MLRPMMVAPIPTSPLAANESSRPSSPPSSPNIVRKVRVARAQSCRRIPPTPSGWSEALVRTGGVPVEGDRDVVHAQLRHDVGPSGGDAVTRRSEPCGRSRRAATKILRRWMSRARSPAPTYFPRPKEVRMKYMLLIYNRPGFVEELSEQERTDLFAEVDAIMARADRVRRADRRAGAGRPVAPLEPSGWSAASPPSPTGRSWRARSSSPATSRSTARARSGRPRSPRAGRTCGSAASMEVRAIMDEAGTEM